MKLPVKLVRVTNSVATCLKANSPKILVGNILSMFIPFFEKIKRKEPRFALSPFLYNL